MRIKNATVLDGRLANGNAAGKFAPLDIEIEGDTIKALTAHENAACGENDIDAKGLYVVPGMIDIHTHGAAGVDFVNNPEYEQARHYYASRGITSICATIRTMSIDKTVSTIKNVIAETKKDSVGTHICGIHIEGPFIAKEKQGAMTATGIDCTVDNFIKLYEASEGLLRVMTIAPDRENAIDVIKAGAEHGVRMSLGHTSSDYDCALTAVDAGATGSTHTFNAMTAYNHRKPGILGVALTDERVICEMISDFVHLHPATMRLIYQMKGAAHVAVISDCGAMTGMGDGEYIVDGRVRYVKDGVCLTADGTIAGSTKTMDFGAQNLLSLGIPMEEVAMMTSLTPARAIGMADKFGSIAEGKRADLIICDDKFNIKAVLVGGKIVPAYQK